MMEMFMFFFSAIIAGSIAIALLKFIFTKVCWHLFGWRPAILDKVTVEQTVEECTAEALRNDAREMEAAGHIMSDEQKQQHFVNIQKAFRLVIERYIENFSTQAGR
jgi:hypothetical protein